MNLPTMIITIAIGALLVVAGFYYGGPLLNAGSIGANANSMTNAGQNVALAFSAFKAENPGAALPTVDNLITAQYLRAHPQLDGIIKSGGAMAIDAALGVVAPVANLDICNRINTNLKLGTGGAFTATAQAAPNVGSACYRSNSAVAGNNSGDFIYFLKA